MLSGRCRRHYWCSPSAYWRPGRTAAFAIHKRPRFTEATMSRLKAIALTGATLAAIAIAAPLAAQRSDLPVVTAPEIQFTQWKLANGLTVIALPDTTTATVTTSMWYDVGAKNGPEGRSGFAHLSGRTWW